MFCFFGYGNRSKVFARVQLIAIAALAFVGMGGRHSEAATINLQFGDTASSRFESQVGPGVVGAAGDYWNPSAFAVSGLSLRDSRNNPTGVTFSNSGSGGEFTAFGTWGFQNTVYANLMKGYLFSADSSESSPNTFTFDGLDSSKKYSLYIYSQGDSATGGRQLGVRVDGTTLVASPSDDTASTFIANQNYLLFSNISPVAGQIQGDWWRVTSEANINGMQLLETNGEVPEPTSAAIALLFLGGGALRRLRRKSQARA